MKEDIAIIIPTYNPDKKLNEVIKELKQNEYSKIIVINDGSNNANIFNKIANNVTIINHKENMGKGEALKTGFKYCLEKFNDIIGVITIDADGQHLVKDVNKVYEKFKKNQKSLILGSRKFKGKQVPLKSKVGNIAFRNIIRMKTKVKIRDTQTGLRAIPLKYLKEFIEIEGKRYEYETNVILYCIKNNIEILEVDIEDVYINKNKNSNFKTIIDSIKIYKATIGK